MCFVFNLREAYGDGGQDHIEDLIEVVHDLDFGVGLDIMRRSFSGCFGKRGGAAEILPGRYSVTLPVWTRSG